jgi:hypothetical protein
LFAVVSSSSSSSSSSSKDNYDRYKDDIIDGSNVDNEKERKEEGVMRGEYNNNNVQMVSSFDVTNNNIDS